MKLLSCALAGATLFCEMAFADQNGLQKQTIEACSWWSYDFDINGYVCRRTLPAITVYSAVDVDKQVDRLEKIIASLEERVKVLEQK